VSAAQQPSGGHDRTAVALGVGDDPARSGGGRPDRGGEQSLAPSRQYLPLSASCQQKHEQQLAGVPVEVQLDAPISTIA
jgi:hypothetical protein